MTTNPRGYLGPAPETEAPEFGEDPVDGWIGAIASFAGDESSNHDHYLYGWPKETDREA
jgi:hypothetical protein